MSDTVQLFKDMGPVKLVTMAVVTMLILGGMIFMSIHISTPSVVPLFSGLDSDDSSKIAAELEGMGIYYEMHQGGSQIMVPHDKVLNVRMNLAKDGLPSGRANIGYELFDKDDALGVSSFVNNVNLLRALEGELGRTITAFEKIETARVHLVIPKQDIFSKRKQEPTASVILKVRGGQIMERSEITAISHLVATAVPGLNIRRITIVDVKGRPFKKGASSDDDPGFIASNSEEFRVQYEKRIKNTIEDLVSRSVGVGRVEVQVSANIDFDKITMNSEIFDPDGQVARSVQTTEERGDSTDGGGGGVSAGNNLPGGEAQTQGGAKNTTERIDEVTNYEVSKTIKHHVKETGTVTKLSIAVLVDGTYTFDEETEEYNYSARPDEELKKLKTLVKSAVGFDEDRGDTIEVINMRFSTEVQGAVQEKRFDWLTRDFSNIIQTLVIGVVVTMIILLIVKPMVGRAFEITKSESEEVELQAALAGEDLKALAEITGQDEGGAIKKESLIDMESFEERMNQSSVGAINDIIERHTEEAVTILRGWLEDDTA